MRTAPANMSAIAASLQTSLQNFSLDHYHHHHPATATATDEGGSGFETSSDSRHMTSDTFDTVELNSNISLPYHWEQCLDLKTGEVYYINWRTGMKAKDDPRMTGDHHACFYSTTDEDEDESWSYSGGSSSSSSDSSSAVSSSRKGNSKKEEQVEVMVNNNNESENDDVLVVAGCRRCMMYLMVAKQADECPKCSAQLLHFHSSIHPYSLITTE